MAAQNGRFVWLDLVRGLSAMLVCAGHLRAAIVCGHAEVPHAGVVGSGFYFMTGLGHAAVMVFFVLSGYFIGGSILKSGARFSLADYALARLTRLWVVLIPALLLTLALDRVVALAVPHALEGAYRHLWNSGPRSAADYSASWGTFLANLLFLQSITTPVFGTNGPLWSLANEFWYYAMFPMMAVAMGRCGTTGGWVRVACATAAVVTFAILPAGICSGYAVWLMGVGVYLLTRKLSCMKRPRFLLIAALLFGLSLVFSRRYADCVSLSLAMDLAVGLGFSALCLAIACWPAPGQTRAGRAVGLFAVGSSAFSYSLYTCHFPIVILLASLEYGTMRLHPDARGLLIYTGWYVGVLACGALFWFLFERQTGRIRGTVSRLIKPRPAS